MRYILTILLSLSLIGCGKPKPQLDRLQPGETILAFGDSLTAGKGVPIDHAYPAQLAVMLGLDVVNAGVSGETTAKGLRRLPDELNKHDPDLVILFQGGNDILRNHDLAKTKANLDAMIQLIKDSGSEVVLVGVPKRSLFSDAAELYPELAEQHQLALQKSIVAKLLKKPGMKSDSVHFNNAGYKALAESIRDLLDAHGAV